MRAQLAAAALLIAGLSPALAGPRDDVLYGISRCGGISDDRVWLNCVYGAAQPMRQQLGLPPAPISQTQLVPRAIPGIAAPVAAAPMGPAMAAAIPARPVKKSFWSKLWAEGHDPVVSAVLMTDYRFDKKGAFTITLANGEVWTQDPREKHFADWKGAAHQFVVSIVPQDDGTFRLHVAGDVNTFQVRRGG